MKQILSTALVLAACAFLISLVYTKLPIETLSGDSSTTKEAWGQRYMTVTSSSTTP